MGDPAGIGPEVVLKAALAAPRTCRLVVLGDLATLTETAVRLGAPLTLVSWQPGDPYPAESNVLPVFVLSQLGADERQPGRPTPAGGEASYGYVETGARLALDNTLQGLVTAPISKAMWHAAGHTYPGQKRIIAPAVRQAQSQGLAVDGPFAADTVFVRAVRGEFDGVVCLYHDQGLIPLKLLSWEEGVNVTLGLPIVRTSPDHGTAFDIAGQGKADPRSLQAALALAAEMTMRETERER